MSTHTKRHRITDRYALVTRKGSARWYLEWREPGKDKQRRATGTASLDEALVRAREIILGQLTGEKAPPAEVSIADVLDKYRLQHGPKVASADIMRRALTIWKEHWGARAVAALTPDALEAFVGIMRVKHWSDGYIRRILAVGKAALNRAYRRGMIAAVPYVELPPVGDAYPHVATRAQLVAWLNLPLPEHVRTYTMIRLCTGCRGDAALELQPFQVDHNARLVLLNPPGRQQTKKYRATVPLTDTLAAVLAECPAAQFYVNWQGHQVTSLRTTWRKMRIKANLPAWWAPKVLRHTVATELRRRGVPEWEASGQLGHRTAGTTEIYAKFSPDYLGKAAAAIDEWMADLARDVPRLALTLAKRAQAQSKLRSVK